MSIVQFQSKWVEKCVRKVLNIDEFSRLKQVTFWSD